MHSIHTRRAFTLVELLVVIAVIGILVGLLLPAIQAAREAGRKAMCKSNLKQIGVAIQLHHDSTGYLPPGWVAEVTEPDGEPGWGWAAHLLPFMEQDNLARGYIEFSRPILDPASEKARTTVLPIFLCASEPYSGTFILPEGDSHHHAGQPALSSVASLSHEDDDHDGDDDHEHDEDDHDEDDHDADHEGHFDEGEPLIEIARGNYVGMFGSEEIAENPSQGNGVFFHNSRLAFRHVSDGLSNTIFVGERSSRLGGSTWVGVVEGAREGMARIVGSTDHAPNADEAHFDDFSSRHPLGVHFLLGDGSVRMINDEVDLTVYQAMATRAGREIISAND